MTREQRASNLRFWLVVAAICAVGLYAEHWYFNRTAVPSDTETTQSAQQSGLYLQMLTGGMGMPMGGGGMPPGGAGVAFASLIGHAGVALALGIYGWQALQTLVAGISTSFQVQAP